MKITFPVLVASMLLACVAPSPTPVLVIASDATFPPFHWIDEAGDPTGFDIDLAKAIAADSGYVARVEVLPYAELFDGLTVGAHDIVAATTGITSERQKQFDFSDPYFTTCQVAVVRRGRGEPQRLSDLAGQRIGAAGSGTSAGAMRTIDGIHMEIADGAGRSKLLDGTIDAWIVDEFDGVQAVREFATELHVIRQGVRVERYGFVLARGREKLRADINASLSTLAANGTLERLRERFEIPRETGWPVDCE